LAENLTFPEVFDQTIIISTEVNFHDVWCDIIYRSRTL